jgi:excisionase family DNA binding protein
MSRHELKESGFEDLLTYEQVARVLQVTPRTVWTHVKEGRLRSIKFGRSVRVAPADLAAFIERSTRLPAQDGGEQ